MALVLKTSTSKKSWVQISQCPIPLPSTCPSFLPFLSRQPSPSTMGPSPFPLWMEGPIVDPYPNPCNGSYPLHRSPLSVRQDRGRVRSVRQPYPYGRGKAGRTRRWAPSSPQNYRPPFLLNFEAEWNLFSLRQLRTYFVNLSPASPNFF